MCQNLRLETSLFIKLLEIDREIATEVGRHPLSILWWPLAPGPLPTQTKRRS